MLIQLQQTQRFNLELKSKLHSKPILTGSRAYGKPNDFSDYDYFLLWTQSVEEALTFFSSEGFQLSHKPYSDNDTLRFKRKQKGEDVIVCLTARAFSAFAQSKAMCLACAPCSREEAISIHKQCFKVFNV